MELKAGLICSFLGHFRAVIFISCCLKFNWVPVPGFPFLCPSSVGKNQALRAERFLCTQVVIKTLARIKSLDSARYDGHGHASSTSAPRTFMSKAFLTPSQKKMHLFVKENKTHHLTSVMLLAACYKHFCTNVISAILSLPSHPLLQRATLQIKTKQINA